MVANPNRNSGVQTDLMKATKDLWDAVKAKAIDIWRRAPTVVAVGGLGVLLLCSSCCVCTGIASLFFRTTGVGIENSRAACGELSGVDPATYLKEMRKGRWDRWNTPRKYEKLDGTGRKLLRYDKTREAITVEVEIEEVEQTDDELDFPWTNYFVSDSLEVYRRPIPLAHILTIPGFENFAVGRSANWNVTREQYERLRAIG